jgi:hypothetical protein
MTADSPLTIERKWGLDASGNAYFYPEFGTDVVLYEDSPGFDPERLEAVLAKADEIWRSEFPSAPMHVIRRIAARRLPTGTTAVMKEKSIDMAVRAKLYSYGPIETNRFQRGLPTFESTLGVCVERMRSLPEPERSMASIGVDTEHAWRGKTLLTFKDIEEMLA